MGIDVSVHVSQNYKRVAAELRRTADGELKREMTKAINAEAKPAQSAVKRSVPAYMPNRGGYAALFARSLRLRTVQRMGGVQISAQAEGKQQKRDVGGREAGSLRHPKWGRRWHPWAAQAIRPGFFSEPIRERRDNIQRAIHDAIQRVADKIG